MLTIARGEARSSYYQYHQLVASLLAAPFTSHLLQVQVADVNVSDVGGPLGSVVVRPEVGVRSGEFLVARGDLGDERAKRQLC